MGIVNMLLTLPASKELMKLPAEQTSPLTTLMSQLREQASVNVDRARKIGATEDLEYWKLVSTYAKYVVRAFKRENIEREHRQQTDSLMAEIGIAPKRLEGFIGAQMFRPPSASKSSCFVEVQYDAFAPWIEAGDLVEIDLTVYRIMQEGLYLVAADSKYLAIRGFHRTRDSFYIHEDGSGEPQKIQVLPDRIPEGYDIVGRVVDVFKKFKPAGSAQ